MGQARCTKPRRDEGRRERSKCKAYAVGKELGAEHRATEVGRRFWRMGGGGGVSRFPECGVTERCFRYRCAHCHAALPRSVWLGRNCTHVCRACGTLLQVPSLWNVLLWLALGAVLMVGAFMGARGLVLVLAAIGTGLFWWVTGMADIFGGWMLPPWVQALKYGRNFCQKCGFDLQGQEVKRCPECGKRFRRVIGSERASPMDRRRGQGVAAQKSD